ncbi:hypothetical protein SFRURICE_019008 [Spodoptera frugiperda]|nr:hypothetical protein SFRURICE_019008 [Spodoptera frugiperda]
MMKLKYIIILLVCKQMRKYILRETRESVRLLLTNKTLSTETSEKNKIPISVRSHYSMRMKSYPGTRRTSVFRCFHGCIYCRSWLTGVAVVREAVAGVSHLKM